YLVTTSIQVRLRATRAPQARGRAKGDTILKRRFAIGTLVTALLSLPSLAGAQTSLSPKDTQAGAGSTVSISLLLSGASKLTVGRFAVSIVPAQGQPTTGTPTITEIDGGTAYSAAKGGCDPTICTAALQTNPALPQTGVPVTSVFLLP